MSENDTRIIDLEFFENNLQFNADCSVKIGYLGTTYYLGSYHNEAEENTIRQGARNLINSGYSIIDTIKAIRGYRVNPTQSKARKESWKNRNTKQDFESFKEELLTAVELMIDEKLGNKD